MKVDLDRSQEASRSRWATFSNVTGKHVQLFEIGLAVSESFRLTQSGPSQLAIPPASLGQWRSVGRVRVLIVGGVQFHLVVIEENIRAAFVRGWAEAPLSK